MHVNYYVDSIYCDYRCQGVPSSLEIQYCIRNSVRLLPCSVSTSSKTLILAWWQLLELTARGRLRGGKRLGGQSDTP